jgi:hypothetical protein
MHVSSFVNNPDETPLHDSGLAPKSAEEAAAMQGSNFSLRQNIEANRSVIRSYKDSLLGQQAATRGELGRYKKPEQKRTQLSVRNRQEQNASGSTPQMPPQKGFKEPSSRGYNPYA